MEILLNVAWTLGTIFSVAALAYGAWLSFVASDLGQDLLGKRPSFPDLSTRNLGTESGPEAMASLPDGMRRHT